MTVPRNALTNIRDSLELRRRATDVVGNAPATPPVVPPPPPPPAPETALGGLFGMLPGGIPGLPGTPEPPPGIAVPPPPPPSSPPLAVTNLSADLFNRLRDRVPDLVIPPRQPVETPLGRRTFTDLAQEAISRLRAASRDQLLEAVRTMQAKAIAPPNLLNWIERKTRIGEVLSAPSSQWSSDTVADFAAAFQMDASRRPIMDLIVAVAILNERELEQELRSENMPSVTVDDLLQNRSIKFQHPPAGTELQPPYIILVAVEYQDLQRAADAVNAILGQLVEAQGFRMPRDAAARIG